jgi:V-type H+-transporting ATPase subunit H
VTDGPQYALLYLTLLKKIERVDTMQNILVSIGDVLVGTSANRVNRATTLSARDHDERIPLFLDASKIDPELPYTPFLKYGALISAFIFPHSVQGL